MTIRESRGYEHYIQLAVIVGPIDIVVETSARQPQHRRCGALTYLKLSASPAIRVSRRLRAIVYQKGRGPNARNLRR